MDRWPELSLTGLWHITYTTGMLYTSLNSYYLCTQSKQWPSCQLLKCWPLACSEQTSRIHKWLTPNHHTPICIIQICSQDCKYQTLTIQLIICTGTLIITVHVMSMVQVGPYHLFISAMLLAKSLKSFNTAPRPTYTPEGTWIPKGRPEETNSY